MSVFEDIEKVAQAASDLGSDVSKHIQVNKDIGSISRTGSKAIYYFPVLVSKNVAPKTMGVIAQNLEGSYCSFVKACFALTPAMNVKNSELVNVEDYLKLFHQNIGLQSKDELYLSVKGLSESMSEYKMFPNDILNEASLGNVSKILDRNTGMRVSTKGQEIYREYLDPYTNKWVRSTEGADKSLDNNATQRFVDEDGNVYMDKNGSVITDIKLAKGIADQHIKEAKINQTRIVNETQERNGFRPSVIEIEVTFIIGGRDVKVSVPVGVKTVLHPVDSDNLLDHIMDSVAGKGILHNLIRWSTGEAISLNDILFGFNKIKDSVKRDNDVDRWLNALKHRKRMNKIRSLPLLTKKPYLPNTSIVISMEDIAEIERTIGYNLLKDVNRTIKFMKDNFLLAFVVTDDVTETAWVLYDGHNQFDEFPYSTIKRENEKNNDLVNALVKNMLVKGAI